jgi:hypothetical protein
MMPMMMSTQNLVRIRAMKTVGKHSPCQNGLVDNAKSRVLL